MGAGRSVTVKVIASVTTICASLIISYQCTHLHHISFTSRSLHTSSKQKQKPVLVQNSRLEPRSSARADRSSDGMDAICLSSADVAISDVGSVHIQRTSRNHISSITYGSAHISLPCPFRTHDNVVGLGQSQTGAPLTGSSPALPRLSSFLSFLPTHHPRSIRFHPSHIFRRGPYSDTVWFEVPLSYQRTLHGPALVWSHLASSSSAVCHRVAPRAV